jgi:hypothetical protein
VARPARPRVWGNLSATTRKRYLGSGASQGLTEAATIRLYESGANLGVFRGHRPHPGASERQWSAMLAAAARARLEEDTEGEPVSTILDSLLSKGLKPNWIIKTLDEKADSRDIYRSRINRARRRAGDKTAGTEPGRSRYLRRTQYADVEIYWYH